MPEYKEVVRYGKTVSIELRVEDCRVVFFRLTGDFFINPEEALDEVEGGVIGCGSAECIRSVLSRLREYVVLGIDLDDLERRIVETYNKLCTDR
ncbi:MAG: hypothetical protein QXP68_03020 [Thermosphaera sp.]